MFVLALVVVVAVVVAIVLCCGRCAVFVDELAFGFNFLDGRCVCVFDGGGGGQLWCLVCGFSDCYARMICMEGLIGFDFLFLAMMRVNVG